MLPTSLQSPVVVGPLVCTDDDAMLDPLLDWCSAVGAVPEVVRDAAMARRAWRTAPWILVGDDLAPALAQDPPPRRSGVFVVSWPGRPQPWDHAVALGAEDVLDPADRDRVLATLTAAVDGGGDACVLAVVGGVGGAGASCFASALALEAGRQGLRVLLVDGDPLGGGLDVLLGVESVEGVRWSGLAPQGRALTARSLVDALPRSGNVWVLAADGEPSSTELSSVGLLAAARRGFDVVVCDVGRQFDSLGSELLAQALLTVVLVPEDVRSLRASAGLVTRLHTHTSSLAVVTARRRPGLSRDAIEGVLGLPVVSRIRSDRRLQEALDHGTGPGRSGALRRAIRPVLDLVGPR